MHKCQIHSNKPNHNQTQMAAMGRTLVVWLLCLQLTSLTVGILVTSTHEHTMTERIQDISSVVQPDIQMEEYNLDDLEHKVNAREMYTPPAKAISKRLFMNHHRPCSAILRQRNYSREHIPRKPSFSLIASTRSLVDRTRQALMTPSVHSGPNQRSSGHQKTAACGAGWTAWK